MSSGKRRVPFAQKPTTWFQWPLGRASRRREAQTASARGSSDPSFTRMSSARARLRAGVARMASSRSDDGVLAIAARQTVNLGMIFLEASRVAARIRGLLDQAA